MADDYFMTTGEASDTEATFYDVGEISPLQMAPGLTFAPLLGTSLMLNVVRFEPHIAAPVHQHVEEQLIYVVEGELVVQIRDEERVLGPGMAVSIPSWVPHGARTVASTCIELDIFTPPRRALLDLMATQLPVDPS